MGEVTINTLSLDMTNGSWSGKYYTDYPVKLTAKSKEGYQFAYWETSKGEKISGESAEILLTSDITLKGDVNLDGKLTADDVALLQGYLLGAEVLTAEQAKQADVFEDGTLNIFDLKELKRMLLKQ